MSQLTITIIQTDLYWEDKQANLKMLEEKIMGIRETTEIVVLPEMFSPVFETAVEVPDDWTKLAGTPAASERSRMVLVVMAILSLPVVVPVPTRITPVVLAPSTVQFCTVLFDASATIRIVAPAPVFRINNAFPPELSPLMVTPSAPFKLINPVPLLPTIVRAAPPLGCSSTVNPPAIWFKAIAPVSPDRSEVMLIVMLLVAPAPLRAEKIPPGLVNDVKSPAVPTVNVPLNGASAVNPLVT